MSKNDECWVKPEKGIWIERLLLISHSEKKYSEPMKKNHKRCGKAKKRAVMVR